MNPIRLQKEEVEAPQDFVWPLVQERQTESWSNICQVFFAPLTLQVDGISARAGQDEVTDKDSLYGRNVSATREWTDQVRYI